MAQLIQPDELSYEERNELELRYDGPITKQVIEDKIRMRGACAPQVLSEEQIREQIDLIMGDVAFWAGVVETAKGVNADLVVDKARRKQSELLDKVTALEHQLDAMTLKAAE